MNKSRILYILKYLWQNTDDEHYVATSDILTFLKENNISCDRKTLPGDIEKLCESGIDIEEVRSRENQYALRSHYFELPEIKLLIDAVDSSKFITAKKSAELVDKLSKMTSNYQSESLIRNIYTSERVKPLDEQIYYLVDNINTAINRRKKISFNYYHYNQYRKEVPNIETEALGDLVVGWFDKENAVKEITIDGDSKFSEGDWFDEDADIKITYHSFSD